MSSKGNKVFLLVLDGFVHDYEKYSSSMPNFAKLSSNGVKAEKMIPAFPTLTWPCMTTLNTGLYPESHGIINNRFCDKDTGKVFSYTDDPADYEGNGKFFTKEPLWLSNQKQGGASSVYYWPGYYAFPEKPKYHNKRIDSQGANITTGQQAIDETFEYLSSDNQLNFMVVYVCAPDETGHEYGSSSIQYKEMLEQIDRDILGYLMEKLQPYPDLNLIVVADHGFHDIYPLHTSIRYIEDYLEEGTYKTEPTPSTLCNLTPINGHTSQELVNKLEPLTKTGKYQVYSSGDASRDFPEHLHYRQNKNILPLLILPEPGWMIGIKQGKEYYANLKGSHGYDWVHESMNTIFFAKGPAFKKGVMLKAFESVNVVALLAFLLGIEAKPNNGSVDVFKDVLTHEQED